jgi:hypothetical protein
MRTRAVLAPGSRPSPAGESAKMRRARAAATPLFLAAALSLLPAASALVWGGGTGEGEPQDPARTGGTAEAVSSSSTTDAEHPESITGTDPGEPICTVTYFHRTMRCATCLGMEEASKRAVFAHFAEAVGQGLLRWQALNFDLPENKSYEKQYRLQGSSLVFSEREGGRETRWERVDEIWNHAGNPDELTECVRLRLRDFLGVPEKEPRVTPADSLAAGAEEPAKVPRTGKEQSHE